MKLPLAAFVLLLAGTNAEARVLRILSEKNLAIGNVAPDACEKGRIFAITPQDSKTNQPTAFAEVVRFDEKLGCVATVSAHPNSPLVRVGDLTRAVDLYHGGQDIPGRYDLIREGHKDYAARYKPLVYGGLLFGQTAATLDKGEFLVGLTPFMYGITDRLQIDTTWPLLFDRSVDIGAKFKFYENEDIKLSAYAAGTQYFNLSQKSGEFDIMYDSGSNGHSMSHTRLRYASSIPQQITFFTSNQAQKAALELSTVNEWILKSWHRILFGPKFIAGSTYDLGFLFSMIFVFDHFHGAINFDVNSVRQFNFSSYKQVVAADLFWRF